MQFAEAGSGGGREESILLSRFKFRVQRKLNAYQSGSIKLVKSETWAEWIEILKAEGGKEGMIPNIYGMC